MNKYSNLTQRVITALIGAPIMLAGIYYSEWIYFSVFLFICAISQIEFYKLSGIDGKLPLTFWGTLCGTLIFALSFFIEYGLLESSYYFIVFPLAAIIFLIELYRQSEQKPFSNLAFTFMGIVYVALPFSLLNIISFSIGGYSHEIMLGLILILWANDTGAYFVGTKFGKNKLFERVSPKKSWEGSIGGAMLALGMTLFLSTIFSDLSQLQWFVIAIIIIIAGTYGDLIESLFKRSIEIKDSGTKLPGHGGFLDRFDGLLLASPFIVFYLKVF